MSILSAAVSSVTIPTTFVLVALYQIRENYAFDADGNLDEESPYWKNKGGNEYVVAHSLSVADVVELGEKGGQSMVDTYTEKSYTAPSAAGPNWNGAYQESLIAWSYDEQSEAVLDKVLNIVSEVDGWDNEKDYIIFNAAKYGMTERCMKWAFNVLSDRGFIECTGPHSAVKPGSRFKHCPSWITVRKAA